MAGEDARYRRAEEAICDALATLLRSKPLAAVTMSEVARTAQVSRSTLYAHFENVADIYQVLVGRFQAQAQTFDEHFGCPGCQERAAVRPWCECVRDAGDFAGVVGDSQFLPMTLGSAADGAARHGAVERLQAAGLPADIAEAIALFQMSGCHAVATSDLGRQGDWPRFRQALDRFIQGGMGALGASL